MWGEFCCVNTIRNNTIVSNGCDFYHGHFLFVHLRYLKFETSDEYVIVITISRYFFEVANFKERGISVRLASRHQ